MPSEYTIGLMFLEEFEIFITALAGGGERMFLELADEKF